MAYLILIFFATGMGWYEGNYSRIMDIYHNFVKLAEKEPTVFVGFNYTQVKRTKFQAKLKKFIMLSIPVLVYSFMASDWIFLASSTFIWLIVFDVVHSISWKGSLQKISWYFDTMIIHRFDGFWTNVKELFYAN